LPISRRIVEHFGGRLWLAPHVPGAGACFGFDLPLRAAAAPAHPMPPGPTAVGAGPGMPARKEETTP
jgi:hypothetical protein